MCGGVIELAAAGGVVGLSAVLTQLWNRRMKLRTLFSDWRKRKKVMAYTRGFGFEGCDIQSLGNGCFVTVTTAPAFPGDSGDVTEIVSLDRPQPPKWLASAVVIASILAFFALMFAVNPHR
jgi:hypothetical protein